MISLIFLLSIGMVSAGNNTTEHDPTPRDLPTYDTVVEATEDGHFNITFDNGYNGYCLEYGEKDASKGDRFIVADTSYAIDNENKESVANYLKTYFVDYYDEAMKDKVVTQHMIWHFTDGFDGWRVNKTLVNEIKDAASKKDNSR